MTPALMMEKIAGVLRERYKKLDIMLKAKAKLAQTSQQRLSIQNELEFNAQIQIAFSKLVKGTAVQPSEFYFLDLNGYKGDYILKVLNDAVLEYTCKIHRASKIRPTKSTAFDYALEINRLSTEVLALRQCKKWWIKRFQDLETKVIEDPTC